MELRDLLALVWKRRWVAIGVLVTTLLASAPGILSRPAKYESTAVLALTPDVKQGQGLVASDSLSALLSTYAETAKSSVNLARAQRILGHKLTADIDTSTEAGTGILRITARATNPREAAAAAAATRHPRTSRRSSRARRCCWASRDCSACSPAACWHSRSSSSGAGS
jgi:capsular polysaccharide biosynthesis protein